MKMKKIAAVLTALSVLSGCAGNTASEEAVTTTGTTTEAVISTAETTNETEEITTEKDKEQISKSNSEFDSTKGPEPSGTRPPLFTEQTTVSEMEEIIEITTTESSAVIDENVEYIEMTAYPRSTEYTEFEAIAIIRTFGGVHSYAQPMVFYFPKDERTGNPSFSIVDGWGCYPCAVVRSFEEDAAMNFIHLTNSSPEALYEYIDNNTPVMVWVTEGLAEPVLFAEYEGNKMYNPKECVVLAGYSDTAVCVWSVIEEKYVTYDRALFEQRYTEMGSMALTVVKE